MSFCSGMFSLTSSGLALYDHFGTESNEALMEELEVIEQQLEEIQNIIDDLMSTVKEESVKMQYVNAQRIIMEGLRCYNTYANMTNPVDQLYWSKEFLKWGSFLRESVNFMMDGMLGTGFIASDILQTIEEVAKVKKKLFNYFFPTIMINGTVNFIRFHPLLLILLFFRTQKHSRIELITCSV